MTLMVEYLRKDASLVILVLVLLVFQEMGEVSPKDIESGNLNVAGFQYLLL